MANMHCVLLPCPHPVSGMRPGRADNMVADKLGNLLRFYSPVENCSDICMVQELLELFDLTGKLIFSDERYDSSKFVRCMEEHGEVYLQRMSFN